MGKIQEAGDELFHLFQRAVPAPADRRGRTTSPQSGGQMSASLERFYVEAKALRAKHRMGIISRARIVRHLQNRMIAAGYEADLVYRVVFALILSAFVGRGK